MNLNFEKISNGVAINHTARVVANARGEHYDLNSSRDSSYPIPFYDSIGKNTDANTKRLHNLLVGKVNGRITVLGELMKHKKVKNGTSGRNWVCICSCGRYTVRGTRTLKKNNIDMCDHCRKSEKFRKF